MMFMWIFLLLLSSMLGGEAVVGVALALEPPGVSTDSTAMDEKTTITSKHMTVKNQESRAIFEGAVVLTRGPLIVRSDVMVVMFQSADAQAGQQARLPPECRVGSGHAPGRGAAARGGDAGATLPAVSNRAICLMEATGHVIIDKDDGRATSNKAVYSVRDQKIVLTGDPVACQRGTRVSGEKITIYLNEDRSEVEGGSRVLIDPDGGGC